jgi:inward rectifier potassium channel
MGVALHRNGISMSQSRHKIRQRLVKIGDRRVMALGVSGQDYRDLYHYALSMSWPSFVGCFAALFVVVNLIFAGLYALGDGAIAHARDGHFEDLFYFSIETFATLGYGDMHPQSDYAHMISSVEVFAGMLVTAVVTGVVFARFALPHARILFADVITVGQHEGVPTLMIRMANERHNVITDAKAKLWIAKVDRSKEGVMFRRFYELKIERSHNPIFALSWTLFHPITPDSPMWGLDQDGLESVQASFIVTFSGHDEATGQQMNARKAYSADDVMWGHHYADILGVRDDGLVHLDYRLFHVAEPDIEA